MASATGTYRGVHLTVKCLCGCGGAETADLMQVTLESVLEDVDVSDMWGGGVRSKFSHFIVTFLFPDGAEWRPFFNHKRGGPRFSIRGESDEAVFGIPDVRRVWMSDTIRHRTFPDRDEMHYAVRIKK